MRCCERWRVRLSGCESRMAGAWDWQPPYISDHKYNTLKKGGGGVGGIWKNTNKPSGNWHKCMQTQMTMGITAADRWKTSREDRWWQRSLTCHTSLDGALRFLLKVQCSEHISLSALRRWKAMTKRGTLMSSSPPTPSPARSDALAAS